MPGPSSVLDHLSRRQILSVVDSEREQIALWSGAVGAGKTHASLLAFLLAIPKAPTGGLIVILAQSTTTAYANIFQLLQDPARFGKAIADNVHYSQGAKKAMILGREVLVVGAKDLSGIGRIQGSTIGLAYVDEAVLMPVEVWNMLTTRIRIPGARLLATMNPGSKNHYMMKDWIKPGHAKGVVHFTLTMKDNPIYNRDAWGLAFQKQMAARYSGLFYDRMILGQWTNAEGAVYSMWDPDRHLIPYGSQPRMQKILGVGIDFGITNPTRGVMLGLSREQRPRLVLMHEFAHEGANEMTRAAPSTLATMYREWLDVPHSPYDNQPVRRHVLDPSAGPLFEELRKQNLKGLMLGNNKVLPGIMTIQNLLTQDRLVAVEGMCPMFEEEVTEYRWDAKASKEGRDEPDKGPNADHSLDATRYAVHTLKVNWHRELELQDAA
jgi:PBSX family phage terminase large subunit